MRIITGTGRCGTSFLTKLFQECGYNVGDKDRLNPEVNGGMEDTEVRRINEAIKSDLCNRGNLGLLPNILEPDTVEELADKYREAISVFDGSGIYKDPRFLVTFPVWDQVLKVDKVIVCVRELSASANSARSLGWSQSLKENIDGDYFYHYCMEMGARLGVFFNFLFLNKMPFSVIRFPQMVEDVEEILQAVRDFVWGIRSDLLVEAHKKLADRELIHF